MRLVLVDDNHQQLGSLGILLGGEPGITVVGAFTKGEHALDSLEGALPDVMLVGMCRSDMSGIDLIRNARLKLPHLDIIVYTDMADRETLLSAIRAGASGYLLKGGTPRELVEALYNLHHGGAPLSPKIARVLIREFQAESQEERFTLSPKETLVLRSLQEGLTYKKIAEMHNVSPHTVHTHIKHIYEKLHAKNRQQALLHARKKGII